MDDYSDEQLVARYLKGEEKALETLIAKYLKPVYRFVFRYFGNAAEAEDVVQEVFLRVWRNIKKFNPRKSRFANPRERRQKSFKVWIFAIAKNTSLDFLKKKKAAPFSDFDNEDDTNAITDSLVDPAPLASDIFERKDLADILESALEQLPVGPRSVIVLHHDGGLTFQEIADASGESLNTVKSRYRRSLLSLREILMHLLE
ncbi:MAG TPA: RNA polymerase sigma factor [Candidatus Paceibacterota bacterium]|nr:RNA polymerase sigma factor [Candidatus Paceibacterota bacterium]